MPKPKKPPKKQPKKPPTSQLLKGWKAIAAYLGIGEVTAQRWAKGGMPVRREGRFTVADPNDVRQWLGKEAHMAAPAHIVSNSDDISAALKESISAVRLKGKA